MNRTHVGGIVLVALAAALWGTTGTAATFAPQVGPLAIGSSALGIGGLLQALTAVPSLRAARAALARNRRTVLIGGLAVAIYPLAFYSSMRFSGVAVGTVVSLASAPLAAGILERVVDGKRLTRTWLCAAVLGIAGGVLLSVSTMRGAQTLPTGSGATAPSLIGPGLIGTGLIGIGLGLVAGATFATYSWATRRLIGRGIARSASMGSVFGVGGLLLMPVLAVTGAPLLASGEALAVGAYMALIPMFVGYLLFGLGLARVSAATATVVSLLEPAVAALLAVIVVGERLTVLGWSGIALIGLGLLVLTAASRGGTLSGARARPRQGAASSDPSRRDSTAS